MNGWRGFGTILLGGIMVVGPAPEALGVPGAGDEAESHCVVEVKPIGQADVADIVCFDSEADAALYLDGVIGAGAARGALAETVLGVAYKDANGGGSSFTFWGSSGCAGVVFGFSSLPSDWDNTISSASGSNGCWATLYSEANYQGSRLNCTPWCGSIYGLNDTVSSLVFRPSGTFG